MRSSPFPLPRIHTLTAATALVIGALAGAGCGAKQPAEPLEAVPSPVYRKPLKTAAGYEPWSGPGPQIQCKVRDVPAACAGVERCPVIRNQALTCDMPVSEVAASGGTAVFGFVASNAERPFAIWPADKEPRVVSAPGGEPRPVRGDKGILHVVRVEQRRLVDYRLDPESLSRRSWDVVVGEDQHLMTAGWTGDALIAWLSVRSSPYSKEVKGGFAGPFAERDVGPPPGNWPYPVVPTWSPGGYPNAVLYGSAGVGLTAGERVWLLPASIASTAAERDVLPAGSLVLAPAFAFRSFDLDARSGVHFLVPTLLPLEGQRPVPLRDMHFLATRAARTNDCPRAPEPSARACAQTETASEGCALAATSDRNPWLAYILTTREHRALAQVVCPPPPRCPAGMPCRQAPCTSIEKNVRDSVRRELVVVQLGSDRADVKLAFRLELTDLAGADVVSALDMGAEGSDLHVVLKAGDSLLRRLQLDTTAMRLVPLGPDELTLTDVKVTASP